MRNHSPLQMVILYHEVHTLFNALADLDNIYSIKRGTDFIYEIVVPRND